MSATRRDCGVDAELVASYMASRTGLSTTGPRRKRLLAEITEAMGTAGMRSGEEYQLLLERDPQEFEALAAQLTVGESYFFRDPGQMELLRSEILAERATAHRAGGGLRLWSAGCAEGQEAYTLAILIQEAGLGARTSILATDLSARAVSRARTGVFRDWSLRNVSDEHRQRWFRPVPGGFRVDESLGRLITFGPDNLLHPSRRHDTSQMDVILCRNLLIYLTPDAIEQAASRLASCLAEGGWLLTGPSDPPLRAEGLEAVLTPAGVVYRRQAGSPQWQPVSHRTAEPPPSPVHRAEMGLHSRAGRRGHDRLPSQTAAPSTPSQPAPIPADFDDLASARHALERADYAAAELLARELMGHAEGHRDAAAVLIRALGSAGKLSGAIEAATAAVSLFPVDAELRLLQTLVLLEDGQAEEAAAAARATVYLDPELAVAHIALAQAEASRANVAAARRSLRNGAALLQLMPDDAPVPLAEGETASGLATVVAAQERSLSAAASTDLRSVR